MTDICFYFQVHQPYRLRRIQAFDAPKGLDYWDRAKNREILDRASRKCYLPANEQILETIRRTDGAFRVAYSLSGVFLEQLAEERPDVLQSFVDLADSGRVEFLGETYYHSMASLWDDQTEFKEQVKAHSEALRRHLGVKPEVFRNTELVYDDRIARTIAGMGWKAILTEGTERILGTRSPNHVYKPAGVEGLKVLLKNYRLSDDVAFRFSNHGWPGFPLTADKYAGWLASAGGDTVNLFMDYETFGEHQWPETGIFQFLDHLPREVLKHPHLRFATPSEVVERHAARDELQVPFAISWADTERDVSGWLGNRMQQLCFQRLKDMAWTVHATGDLELVHAWRKMQTSDHLYYSCTKGMGDGDIHAYFSPYDSPYMAFINHMNAIDALEARAKAAPKPEPKAEPVPAEAAAGAAAEAAPAADARAEALPAGR